MTAFSVKIAGGQTLVDCYDYRQRSVYREIPISRSMPMMQKDFMM
ncbi:MAG: hypothetical protein ACLTFZ_05160 [Lachnospiraceae bacterium]